MSEPVTCPYETLQVTRTASADDIRGAYKRLAILHHPDKNKGSVEATQTFQKISFAYSILSDPEKRERYDSTGCLNEEELEQGDMDDLTSMLFQTIGGGMMFGGGPMFFETGRGRNRARVPHLDDTFFEKLFKGRYADEFGFGSHGRYADAFDFDSDGEPYEEYPGFEEEMLYEVLPGLFCEHFIEELDHLPKTQQTGNKKLNQKSSSRPIYKCTLCSQIMRSEESAEEHFMIRHNQLFNDAIALIEENGLEFDIHELFEDFAEKVRKGEIKEKAAKKEKSTKKKKKRVPTSSSTTKPQTPVVVTTTQ
jgi:curved DNA-binding protein CbpA